MKPNETPPAAAAIAASRLLAVPDLVERTGAGSSFWRREIRRHGIRVYRIGDLVRISEADLQEWLAARVTPATPEGGK